MPRFGLDYIQPQQADGTIRGAGNKENLLGTRVIKDETSETGVRYEKRQREWPYDDASMPHIEAEFPRLFPQRGDSFIETRFKQTGRQQVLLDWGCAKGFAAEEFGKKYGDKVLSIGYSMDSYKEWASMQHSMLIQSTADQLFNELDDMGRPIDFVYSRVGLVYLFPGASRTEQVPTERGVAYIERLLNHMSEGGVIAFDVGQPQAEEILKTLKNSLAGKAEVILDDQNLEGDHQIYITKLSQ